jgi:MFS family permease
VLLVGRPHRPQVDNHVNFPCYFGKRYILICDTLASSLSAILWVIGSIIQCSSPNVPALVSGRVISGFSVGLSSAVVPNYQVCSK